MEKQEMTLAEFRKLAKKHGYSARVRTVSFEGFGYGRGCFLSLFIAGKKIIAGFGCSEYWAAFDLKYPLARQWMREITVINDGKKLIWDI